MDFCLEPIATVTNSFQYGGSLYEKAFHFYLPVNSPLRPHSRLYRSDKSRFIFPNFTQLRAHHSLHSGDIIYSSL